MNGILSLIAPILFIAFIQLVYSATKHGVRAHKDDAFFEESYKSIAILHTKLDVDADGEVDDKESKKFLESGNNNKNVANNVHKLKYLHQDGKDTSISVQELWDSWQNSSVHGWSVDETIYWLVNYVDMPQYSSLFRDNSINGTLLPRLAADPHYLIKLGITDPSDKSKISIKAMDVVLFGPPKSSANNIRDMIAYMTSFLTIILLYATYSKLKASQQRLFHMQSRFESLQKAEEQMSELQFELDKAIKAQEAVATEKRNLEHQLEIQRQNSASNLMFASSDTNINSIKANGDNEQCEYISSLEEELRKLQEELSLANEAIVAKNFRAPYQLRTLLQTTYNVESQHYNEKKLSLEAKAAEVKLRNQKLQKKKTSFLGYYKMAQENSLEEDLNTIVEIKEAIMQVTQEIRDRTERWREIEKLCGCSFMQSKQIVSSSFVVNK